jgi:hypothetical protein
LKASFNRSSFTQTKTFLLGISCKYSRTEKYINASLNPLSDLSLSSKGGFLSRARSVILRAKYFSVF